MKEMRVIKQPIKLEKYELISLWNCLSETFIRVLINQILTHATFNFLMNANTVFRPIIS